MADGAVRRPPFVTTRRLIDWAGDGWAEHEVAARREGIGPLMDAPAWLGLSWLRDRFFAQIGDDEMFEDARLYLAGEDNELNRRREVRKLNAVAAAGGEVA